MLPAGSWKLDDSTTSHPRLDSSNAVQQQASNSPPPPPRAIYVRLSDELLQQLKAAQAGNAPFHLELASSPPAGSSSSSSSSSMNKTDPSKASTSKPTAITLVDITYPLIALTTIQSSNKVTDLLESGSRKSSSSSLSVPSLKLAAKNSQDRYDVGPSTSGSGIRHRNPGTNSQSRAATATATVSKEKTAENMGERIRERAAQMAKEKESRKIVIVDDDAFPGAKGGKKGKSAASRAQPNLLRASAISAKRSASPANLPARQSHPAAPSATAARPPNRLLANEAAKGLMKKNGLLHPHSSAGSETKAASPGSDSSSSHTDTPPVTTSTTTVPESSVAIPSSHTTPSQRPSTLLSLDAKAASKFTTAPPQGSPARRQFHQMKVDADDLASASSDSEDEDDAPLAVRTQSPVKTHFSPESIAQPVAAGRAVPAQAAAAGAMANRSTVTSSSAAKIQPKKGRVASYSASSASEGSASDKEPIKSAPTAAAASSSAMMKRLSPESAPSSRASSPGRAATGGPKTVAKTSGGSRLSRPVRKVSPRTSPNIVSVPVPAASTALAVSESASTSSGRPASPPHSRPSDTEMQLDKPADESNKPTSGLLSAAQSPKSTSRAPSPQPSPSSHPLPAKPPPSPSSSKTHMSLHPSPSRATSPPAASVRRTEQERPAQSVRPPTLSLGLPANPITGVMPNIPKSPSSLQPPHPHPFTHTISTVPSAYSTPGASPIVSHFPASSRGSKSPNSGPLRTTTSGKRKDGPVEDAEAANKKKRLNSGTASSLSASTGSEQDGEAEEEEGEYKALPAEPASDTKATPRSQLDAVPSMMQSDTIRPDAPPKPTVNKSGLPSFTKKGRMSELKGREASSAPSPSQAGSQAVSRANTPISYGSMDVERASSLASSSPSSGYKARVTGALRISDEAEFAKRSIDFTEKLYPEYTRLYSKLEDMKERFIKGDRVGNLAKGSGSYSGITPQQIARMVDEVNERSKELQLIKDGLWNYNDERKRRDSMTRVR